MKKFKLDKGDYELIKNFVLSVSLTVLMVQFVPFTFENLAQSICTYIAFTIFFMNFLVGADDMVERNRKEF